MARAVFLSNRTIAGARPGVAPDVAGGPTLDTRRRSPYSATGCMKTTPVRTICDIARLAGVSKSTVSRALNDSPLIGDETKDRVRALAREHKFVMNASARRLSLKQSHVIGLMTHPYTSESSMTDIFMLEVMSGISNGLRARGYDLLLIHADKDDHDWADGYIETGRVDGFIVLSASCTPAQVEDLVNLKAPFIMWGRAADSFAGGKLATGHLLRTGRRRIAFLGGPATELEVADRFGGYEEALREAGIKVDPALVAYGDYTTRSGHAVMRSLLERNPDLDAVFVNSDLMAIAAMDAIREQGRAVPGDVAVVGYDDVAMARFSNPPLTTIRQNAPLAGRMLAENLIQYVEKGVVTNVTIPAELVVRRSA
jgi:DNA-binding LacI/PurR family transcriptional regulator